MKTRSHPPELISGRGDHDLFAATELMASFLPFERRHSLESPMSGYLTASIFTASIQTGFSDPVPLQANNMQ